MLRHNRKPLLAAAAAAAMSVGAAANAAVTVNVVPSSAPNSFGSPNWNAYVVNALSSLENDAGSTGDRSLSPAAYEVAGPSIPAGDILVSGFKSWRGQANPPAPFANELGNRLHFGLHLVGDGVQQFRLVDLQFDITSTDSSNAMDFSGNFAGLNYSATRYGIDWGGDNAKGGGDDTVYTSGNGTTLVDEIVYVGVGNAFDASFEPGATDQDKLDSAIAGIQSEGVFDVTGSYSILDPTDSSQTLAFGFSTVAVPEPAAGLVMLGAAGLLLLRRRRRTAC